MANGIVQGIGNLERKFRSNGVINDVYKMFDKAATSTGFMSKQAGTIAERVASTSGAASAYTTRDAVRFGMATYAGASAVGRVASGGGVYKDAQGNTDLVGIPFI